MSENGLIVQGDFAPVTAKQYQQRVNLIQEVMTQVMKKDTHYGVIPGTVKPSLYKPGAEVLGVTFGLCATIPSVTLKDLPNGHREAQVTIAIKDRSGHIVAEGVGSCSTMESKYRYRKGEGENTGMGVPKEYWDAKRANNIALMQDLLGGKGFQARKIDGLWMIVKASSEKAENPDPADQYNTVLKMAKKRAFVDAILTATGCSDIFTQDVEDMGGMDEPAPPPTARRPEAFRQAEEEDQSKAAPSATFEYDLSDAGPEDKAKFERMLEKVRAQFDDDSGRWISPARISNLKAYLVQGA